MSERLHRGFSPARIFALSINTLIELTRQKVFYVLLIFALLLIGCSVFMARFTFQQEFQILKDISLGPLSTSGPLLPLFPPPRPFPQYTKARPVNRFLATRFHGFKFYLVK